MRHAYLSVLLVSTTIAFPILAHAGSLGAHGETELSGPRVITSDEPAPMRMASARQSNMGGGFIEFLFNGGQDARPMPRQRMEADPAASDIATQPMSPDRVILTPQGAQGEPARPAPDPRFDKQMVDYDGKEAPGTIVIDTPHRFLYLVQGNGRALRYGIGVGRPGFTWSGVKQISQKREWPSWTPPDEMLKRRPDLPRFMEGGPDNPLGARAMYLGSSLYRIHGSNEPWTIGHAVSSGCIRMRNEDVMDLYGRVKVGTRVIVI